MLVPPASAAQAPADALADDPWATVRPASTTRPGDPDGAGRRRGWPATDGTAPAAQDEPHSEPAPGPPALARGGCCAWPLPADATCAAVARGVFKEAAGVLGLPGELEFDGVTMASELAANTLHAHDNVEFDAAGAWPLAGAPELWIYLRPVAGRWELVCKVFDSLCGWKNGAAPVPGSAELDAVSGRGLQVVAGLSGGRWGHHLSRSRLGGRKVPGKAVWFGQPVPASMRTRHAAALPVGAGMDGPGLGGDAHRAWAGRGPPPSPGAGRRDVGALRPVRADRVVPATPGSGGGPRTAAASGGCLPIWRTPPSSSCACAPRWMQEPTASTGAWTGCGYRRYRAWAPGLGVGGAASGISVPAGPAESRGPGSQLPWKVGRSLRVKANVAAR